MKMTKEDQVVVKIVREVVAELNDMIAQRDPIHSFDEEYLFLENEMNDLWDSAHHNGFGNVRMNAIRVAATALCLIIMLQEDER